MKSAQLNMTLHIWGNTWEAIFGDTILEIQWQVEFTYILSWR